MKLYFNKYKNSSEALEKNNKAKEAALKYYICCNSDRLLKMYLFNEEPTIPDFSKYEDPERALKIWNVYLCDILRYDCIKAALLISEICRTSRTLDVRLSYLIIQRELNNMILSERTMPILEPDIDSGGYYDIARRFLEEI